MFEFYFDKMKTPSSNLDLVYRPEIGTANCMAEILLLNMRLERVSMGGLCKRSFGRCIMLLCHFWCPLSCSD